MSAKNKPPQWCVVARALALSRGGCHGTRKGNARERSGARDARGCGLHSDVETAMIGPGKALIEAMHALLNAEALAETFHSQGRAPLPLPFPLPLSLSLPPFRASSAALSARVFCVEKSAFLGAEHVQSGARRRCSGAAWTAWTGSRQEQGARNSHGLGFVRTKRALKRDLV